MSQSITDYRYAIPQHTPGICRVWICRPVGDQALVVLTDLPSDPGPGLRSHLAAVVEQLSADHSLVPDETLWVYRRVGPRRKEDFSEFPVLALKSPFKGRPALGDRPARAGDPREDEPPGGPLRRDPPLTPRTIPPRPR